jgi:hypothetical protein
MDYNVGDLITYLAFGGVRRTVRVTAKSEDIKNGRPGFDGYTVGHDSQDVWGYDDQIVAVTR